MHSQLGSKVSWKTLPFGERRKYNTCVHQGALRSLVARELSEAPPVAFAGCRFSEKRAVKILV